MICAADRKFRTDKRTRYSRKPAAVFKKLKPGKTYFVKVQAYKPDSAGEKVYSKESLVLKKKIK